MKSTAFFAVLIAIGIQQALAQPKTTEPAVFVDSGMKVWQFHAKVVGDDYTIYVSLPSDYDSMKHNSPVLYVTDGDWNMNLARDCFSMLEQDYFTTTPIIVGIGYGNNENKRSRDLEPNTGAPAFLSFIETELMPFINNKFHSSGNNALFGYSYGGIFAAYALFEHPGVFSTILIGAPGNGGGPLTSLTAAAKKYFGSHDNLKCNVFAGVGSYEPEKSDNVRQFGAYLKTQNDNELNYKTEIIPGLAHGAGLAPVMLSAMKFAYCHTHTSIPLQVNQLIKYAGNYRNPETPGLKLRLFIKNNNLYLQVGDIKTLHLVPYEKNKFFMYEDEKTEILFGNQGIKPYLLFTTPDGKFQRIDKIN